MTWHTLCEGRPSLGVCSSCRSRPARWTPSQIHWIESTRPSKREVLSRKKEKKKPWELIRHKQPSFHVQSRLLTLLSLPAESVGNSPRICRRQRRHLTGVIAPWRASNASVQLSSSQSQERAEKTLLCHSLLFF